MAEEVAAATEVDAVAAATEADTVVVAATGVDEVAAVAVDEAIGAIEVIGAAGNKTDSDARFSPQRTAGPVCRMCELWMNPLGPRAWTDKLIKWTDKLINMKDTYGKESKHRRETSAGNGKEEKSRGKKGAAPQKEGTGGRASCDGNALGSRQLT